MESAALVNLAKPIVWRRGFQAGFSEDDRADVLQDVLLKYMQAWPDGSEPDNIAAWIETTTANTIIDRVRASERRPADQYADGGDDPLSLLVAAVRSAKLASAPTVSKEVLDDIFALIPDDDAYLLRERYLKNYTASELAGELGITVATLDQRTTRAKRKLRDALLGRPDLVEELRAPHPHVY
jgi:RNA polymerase sigma factor (sigma-70 family)